MPLVRICAGGGQRWPSLPRLICAIFLRTPRTPRHSLTRIPIMPRRPRVVVAGLPHHVTQRGVDRCPVFESDFDRRTYLRLLGDHLSEAQVRVLGWCLMTNHVHLILLPELDPSLSLLLRRVHGRYAQYFNAHAGRSGHLWQNRYFACPLGPGHVLRALAYVDANPVRAGLVERARDYPWSSGDALRRTGHPVLGGSVRMRRSIGPRSG